MEAIKGKGQFFRLIPTNSIKPEFRRKGEQEEGVGKQHNLSQCGNDKDRNPLPAEDISPWLGSFPPAAADYCFAPFCAGDELNSHLRSARVMEEVLCEWLW